MREEEFNTLKKLVEVNKSFCNAVKEKDITEIDICIKFELTLLFFKLNKEKVIKLNDDERSLILGLIDDNDYVLIDAGILYKGEIVKIEYLLCLVEKLNETKINEGISKIINVNFTGRNYKQDFSNKGSKVIDIRAIMQGRSFSLEERAYMLERTSIVDNDTLPFINENRKNFIESVNKLILNIIKDEEIEDFHLIEILMFYINLYPFLNYVKGKVSVPFEFFKIPQNEIGISKLKIYDEYCRKVEEYLAALTKEHEELLQQKRFFTEYGLKEKIQKVEFKIRDIEIKIYDCSFEFFKYVHESKVFNEHLLRYMGKSIEQGNVFTTGSTNPVVKMFCLEKERLDFFCAVHLDTLIKLIEINDIFDFGESGKVLKK